MISVTWRHAIVRSTLTRRARHLALVLSTYMDNNGDSCFPGYDTLAKETRWSVRTVQRGLAELRAGGWIIAVANAGGGRGRYVSYIASWPGERLGVGRLKGDSRVTLSRRNGHAVKGDSGVTLSTVKGDTGDAKRVTPVSLGRDQVTRDARAHAREGTPGDLAAAQRLNPGRWEIDPETNTATRWIAGEPEPEPELTPPRPAPIPDRARSRGRARAPAPPPEPLDPDGAIARWLAGTDAYGLSDE